jgi:hypothetical protein
MAQPWAALWSSEIVGDTAAADVCGLRPEVEVPGLFAHGPTVDEDGRGVRPLRGDRSGTVKILTEQQGIVVWVEQVIFEIFWTVLVLDCAKRKRGSGARYIGARVE